MNNSILEMISNAGVMVQIVMVVLLFFSVFSWAIIFQKFIVFLKISRVSQAFLSFIKEHENLPLCYEAAKRYQLSPFAKVFLSAYKEAARTKNLYIKTNPLPISYLNDDMEHRVRRVIDKEMSSIRRYLPFLATTGNTAPFIGLYGTVWGIMSSFKSIGLKKSANLAVVAPGIAEALIATATGLFAAIPAVIAYNHYLNKSGNFLAELENFGEDIIGMIIKELDRRGQAKTSLRAK